MTNLQVELASHRFRIHGGCGADAGHFICERMSGSRSNVMASISTPVESSRPVLGHLTITTLTSRILLLRNPPQLAYLIVGSL